MPQDPGIIKINHLNGSSPEIKPTTITLEELEYSIRLWVKLILSNIDPPAGLRERIKNRAQQTQPWGNSYGS